MDLPNFRPYPPEPAPTEGDAGEEVTDVTGTTMLKEENGKKSVQSSTTHESLSSSDSATDKATASPGRSDSILNERATVPQGGGHKGSATTSKVSSNKTPSKTAAGSGAKAAKSMKSP